MSDQQVDSKVVIVRIEMANEGGEPRWEITCKRFSSRHDYRASANRNPSAADLPADVRQAIAQWVGAS